MAKSISTTIRLRNDQNPVAHFAVIDGVSAMASTPGAVPKPGSLGPAGIPPPTRLRRRATAHSILIPTRCTSLRQNTISSRTRCCISAALPT